MFNQIWSLCFFTILIGINFINDCTNFCKTFNYNIFDKEISLNKLNNQLATIVLIEKFYKSDFHHFFK